MTTTNNPPSSTDTQSTVYVSEHRVACDGGGGSLGHPKVWYSLEDGKAVCGYCDREFIYDTEKAKA